MDINIPSLIFLCAAGFLAAFVDSIAGGGGLISIPAYMFIGLPQVLVNGTNKFSASCGMIMSASKFIKNKKADMNVLKFAIPLTAIGAALGVSTALSIPDNILRSIVSVMIVIIGVYTYFSKSLGLAENFKGYTKKNTLMVCVLALLLGFYDGFFGPGTGAFLCFALISIYGFEFTKASGTARVLNLTSGLVSLTLYAFSGNVAYMYGIPVAIFAILGGKLGTQFALKNGAKFIKPIFIIMSILTAIKMVFDML